MVEKNCNKLIFSGIVQQAIMNDISKIPWNPNCGNYKIIPNISFLVPLLLGQMPACLMTWCALQGLSTLPQHSLFNRPHMVWLAACQALPGGADAVVWNSLSVNLEWLQLTTLSYHNQYWLLVKISNSSKQPNSLNVIIACHCFPNQSVNQSTNQSINQQINEGNIDKNKKAKLPTITHFTLSLLILASWIFTISEECDPEDISKIPGIPFVEIVWVKMSASDDLDHTPNQSSYLMNHMSYKYDVNIYIMF